MLRYLAAFGPATVADVATWSRLTALGEVLDRLRPRLRIFHDERGRELFDLPDAPRPDPDTPAPPRFLPEYDNAVLSHADRSRFLAPEVRPALTSLERPVHGSVLIDGMLRATWRIDATGASPGLVVDHVGTVTKRWGERVVAEGRRLMGLLHPGGRGEVRLARLDA